jgi:hypothetical protein
VKDWVQAEIWIAIMYLAAENENRKFLAITSCSGTMHGYVVSCLHNDINYFVIGLLQARRIPFHLDYLVRAPFRFSASQGDCCLSS